VSILVNLYLAGVAEIPHPTPGAIFAPLSGAIFAPKLLLWHIRNSAKKLCKMANFGR
jgi:hypothetical protein